LGDGHLKCVRGRLHCTVYCLKGVAFSFREEVTSW